MPEARWVPAGGGSPGGIRSRVAPMDFGGGAGPRGPAMGSDTKSMMEALMRKRLSEKLGGGRRRDTGAALGGARGSPMAARRRTFARVGGLGRSESSAGEQLAISEAKEAKTARREAAAAGRRFMPESISNIAGGTYRFKDPGKLSLKDQQLFGPSETKIGASTPTTFDFGAHLDPSKAAGGGQGQLKALMAKLEQIEKQQRQKKKLGGVKGKG